MRIDAIKTHFKRISDPPMLSPYVAMIPTKSTTLPPLTCPSCAQVFIPRRAWQKYCSRKCKCADQNARMADLRAQEAAYYLSLAEENIRLRSRIAELEEHLCIQSTSTK